MYALAVIPPISTHNLSTTTPVVIPQIFSLCCPGTAPTKGIIIVTILISAETTLLQSAGKEPSGVVGIGLMLIGSPRIHLDAKGEVVAQEIVERRADRINRPEIVAPRGTRAEREILIGDWEHLDA